MTRLVYIANVRIPTEKAHGLQITQNCEAFADAGADVALWVARRFNTSDMQQVEDVFAHYGVKKNFTLRRLFTLDLMPLVPERTDPVARAIFYLQLWSFVFSATLRLLFVRPDVVYSRTPLALLAASWVMPRHTLTYEAHQLAVGRFGRWLQKTVLRRVGAVIAVTEPLRDDLLKLGGVDAARVIVAHDGIRRARFEPLPSQAEARDAADWPKDAFIVGYVGRLHTMKMDKGVGTMLEALRDVDGAHVALVGGPDDMADELRDQWIAWGREPSQFLYAGQVPPDDVPRYMRTFDVCVMPLPFTPHFAYHASPLKLFEYMASGQAVLTTDLPGWADVVQHDHNALLVPPSDVDAMREALVRLRDDATLRQTLGQTARDEALQHHTWDARAKRILAHIATAKG